MSGARGVPRGRDRVLKDEDLAAFKDKVDLLRADGLSISMISERLGVPPGTIRDRLQRHKDSLSEQIREKAEALMKRLEIEREMFLMSAMVFEPETVVAMSELRELLRRA